MAQYPFHKVIWSEGLLVSPQHFQQTDRYHDSHLDFRVQPLVPYGWGAIDLKIEFNIDRYQKNGVLQVTRFSGVLPSGATINIPDGDDMPDSRTVKLQDVSSTTTDVYVAIPTDQPDGLNYHMDCETLKDTRYVAKFVKCVDETDTENTQEIVIAQKNLKILFGSELNDTYERIKIAELVKQTDGSIIINPDYVPPCLVFSASAHLSSVLQDLVHRLTDMSTALSVARHPHGKHTARETHLETLWVLSILNSAIAVLHHFNHIHQIHPEVVYRSLLQLAGQLDALSATSHIGMLPAYDHENLAVCFGLLNQMIDILLKEVPMPLSGRVTIIELEEAKSAEGYTVLRNEAPLDEQLLTHDYHLYLVVEATAIDHDRQKVLLDLLPDMITVAAFEQIDDYIERAYGLRVTHVHQPHAAPPKPGATYVRLEKSGSTWDRIRSSRRLAIYMPREFEREFQRIDVDLMIIHEANAPREQVLEDGDGHDLSQ